MCQQRFNQSVNKINIKSSKTYTTTLFYTNSKVIFKGLIIMIKLQVFSEYCELLN